MTAAEDVTNARRVIPVFNRTDAMVAAPYPVIAPANVAPGSVLL
jgi:hypothetical protein